MKKTFRLAAVLVTLAALVMASCQNAAGGSGGGGGGGGVTPTPTPQPEGRTIDVEEIALVGKYEVSPFATLTLGSDGTGVFSFAPPSANTRSIVLNDYTFEWALDTVEVEVDKKKDAATNVKKLLVPYLSIIFDDETVGVTGKIKYLKTGDPTEGNRKWAVHELEDGLVVNLGTYPLDQDNFKYGSDPADPMTFAGTIGRGVLGQFMVNGKPMFDVGTPDSNDDDVEDYDGTPCPPANVKAAELTGTWAVVADESVLKDDSGTEVSVTGEGVSAILEEAMKLTDVTSAYVISDIVVKAEGALADVYFLIYDTTLDDEKTKTWELDDTTNKVDITLTEVTAKDTTAGDKYGTAIGVIHDCAVTTVDKSFVITKVAKNDPVDPTAVFTLVTLEANVPFAKGLDGSGAGVIAPTGKGTMDILYSKEALQ